MAKFYRVRDRETGHEYTTALFLQGVHILLDEPAVDADGRTLPAKPNPNPGPITEVQPAEADAEPDADPAAAESGAEGNQSPGRGRRGQPPTSQPSQTDQQTTQGGSTNTGGN